MDVVLQALLGSLPSLGIYTGFGWVLVLLLRREGTAEERHARALDRLSRTHDAELDRLTKAHDAELAELHEDVRREREIRRAVQDELHKQRNLS